MAAPKDIKQGVTRQLEGLPRRPESRLYLRHPTGETLLGAERRSFGFGRAPGNDLELDDDVVSRRHGSIRYKNGQFYLTDDSTNGTLIERDNGVLLSVHQETVLLDGVGVVRLGRADGPGFSFEMELLGSDGTSWIRSPATAVAPGTGSVADDRYVFRREGEYWTLAFDGTVLRVRDRKGLRFLGYLIHHPGQEFHVIDLIHAGSDSVVSDDAATPSWDEMESMHVDEATGAGPTLDTEAKRAYRARLADLRDELSDAERNNDLGRAESLRRESDFIATQLSAAVGLGGRDRETASNAERARVAVTVRIREVVKRLCQHHPLLGDHLERHVKTGRVCCYEPDPAHPIAWAD